MRKINAWTIVIFLAASLVSFQGSATEKISLKIEKSLPQNKLAYYNDAFDKLREDLWEKGSTPHRKEQMSNFRLANMSIENGALKVETKTGGFSRNGLVSKYTLRGDFDIQVDCHIDFLKTELGMDQVLDFNVLEKAKGSEKPKAAVILLLKRPNRNAVINSVYFEKGKPLFRKPHPIGNFHGTLRIVRIDNEISTLYKKEGELGWKKMGTFPGMTGEVTVTFSLSNFIVRRTSIRAESSISATFDNFRINAAQEIMEEEI
jgi:hypothetical protein